ncbi:MAG: TIGR02530 family flagellar biosynthesis protein [Oscillospiraceae bacterium]
MSEEVKLLNRFERIDRFSPSQANSRTKKDTVKAEKTFEEELQLSLNNIKISKHAEQRISERNIALDQTSLKRLSSGIDTAYEKGVKNALIMMDENMFIVNTGSRTVITGTQKQYCNSNVFTNIDGALVI